MVYVIHTFWDPQNMYAPTRVGTILKYLLFADWEVCLVANFDQGLKNTALLRSQFFNMQTNILKASKQLNKLQIFTISPQF